MKSIVFTMVLALFFTKAFEYCSTWLRLDDDFLKYCIFVDVRNRANNPFSFVEKILPYFKVHHSLINDANNLEELHDEYIEFQCLIQTFLRIFGKTRRSERT